MLSLSVSVVDTMLCVPIITTLSTVVCSAYESAIVKRRLTEAKLWVALPATIPDPMLQAFLHDTAWVHDGGTSSHVERHLERETAMSELELYPQRTYVPVMYDTGTLEGGGNCHQCACGVAGTGGDVVNGGGDAFGRGRGLGRGAEETGGSGFSGGGDTTFLGGGIITVGEGIMGGEGLAP